MRCDWLSFPLSRGMHCMCLISYSIVVWRSMGVILVSRRVVVLGVDAMRVGMSSNDDGEL